MKSKGIEKQIRLSFNLYTFLPNDDGTTVYSIGLGKSKG
jgi:hypothetical protein